MICKFYVYKYLEIKFHGNNPNAIILLYDIEEGLIEFNDNFKKSVIDDYCNSLLVPNKPLVIFSNNCFVNNEIDVRQIKKFIDDKFYNSYISFNSPFGCNEIFSENKLWGNECINKISLIEIRKKL